MLPVLPIPRLTVIPGAPRSAARDDGSAVTPLRPGRPSAMASPPHQPGDQCLHLESAGDPTGAGLLPRIREGDEAAFTALFDLYVVPLSVFVLPYVRSREVAADVVHDVFLRIWQGRESLEVHDSLRAYLYRAVRNRALNLLRHQAIEQRWREGVGRSEAAIAQSTAPGVDERLQREELLAEIELATAELPERCRMVFQLRWRDGLHHAEIAEVMGITQKTVENQITRALRSVRARLGALRD
jgi:RNA polymerase sigma-70 factor (ECF subfamily)